MRDLLKTKTFWLGVLTIAGGFYELAFGDQNTGLSAIVAGLAMIFLRDAQLKTYLEIKKQNGKE